MGIAENKQIVIDFYEAGARGDMDRCFALLADDITWTNIGTTRFSGTEELLQMIPCARSIVMTRARPSLPKVINETK